ncbi:hypothetical protein [Nostoc sp. UHCC 0870]|uniref:hypothetical protein n=1 Tax=Nostoc sp. UHCC 0870 TaxID=2914041 RepID=UPI001EE145D5|nr:hypothetical protein [Nostoc sp. UHCC 0870]UKP01598.1 hypothetical protein L6494_30820 [Nostoc sp. UHCC 0870]
MYALTLLYIYRFAPSPRVRSRATTTVKIPVSKFSRCPLSAIAVTPNQNSRIQIWRGLRTATTSVKIRAVLWCDRRHHS